MFILNTTSNDRETVIDALSTLAGSIPNVPIKREEQLKSPDFVVGLLIGLSLAVNFGGFPEKITEQGFNFMLINVINDILAAHSEAELAGKVIHPNDNKTSH